MLIFGYMVLRENIFFSFQVLDRNCFFIGLLAQSEDFFEYAIGIVPESSQKLPWKHRAKVHNQSDRPLQPVIIEVQLLLNSFSLLLLFLLWISPLRSVFLDNLKQKLSFLPWIAPAN